MRAKKIYVLLMLSPTSFATTLSNHFNFDISESSRWTDNAIKESRDMFKYSERQDISDLDLNASYQNEWLAGKMLYNLENLRFSENSQPNDTVLNGSGELEYGGSPDSFHLRLMQSSATLLNTRDAVDITSNRVGRSIFTAEPSLRLHFSDADQFETVFSYSNIKYKNNEAATLVLGQESRDSSAENIELNYTHEINAVDTLRLLGSSGKTAFDAGPLASYRASTVSAEYNVKLRRLNYSFTIGESRVTEESIDKAFNSPKYAAAISYQTFRNTISLNYNQEVSDSSRGIRNYSQSELVDSHNNLAEPGLASGIDVVKYSTAQLIWISTVLCESCTATVSVQNIKEDFFNLNDDLISRGASARFMYRLSRDRDIEFLYGVSKQSYKKIAVNGYQKDTYSHIGYNTKITTNFLFSFLLDCNKRIGDDVFNAYGENIVGLKITYRL